MNWRTQAACSTAPPSWFFPEQGDTARRARMLCAACPVRTQCLGEALQANAEGVWGGFTRKGRAALSRRA